MVKLDHSSLVGTIQYRTYVISILYRNSMVRNSEKYEQALALRRRGFTLGEIASYCAISKSTVSKWLAKQAFSASVTQQNKKRAGKENAKRLQLMSKTRTQEREARYQDAIRTAATEYKHYQTAPLFIAGLLLFRSHGDYTKTNRNTVRFSTTDMEAHRIFIHFVREYLGVEKKVFTCWLQLYPTHNEAKCLRRWQRTTTLPYTQFGKTQFIKGNYRQRKTLHFGVGNTIIGSTVLQHKLVYWTDRLLKELAT